MILQLQKELEETRLQLKESDEYADSLEEKLENYQQEFQQFKEKRIGLTEMNTGRLVGYVTDYFIKSYPTIAQKVPMLSTLSGFLSEENTLPEQLEGTPPVSSGSTVSFSKQASDKHASQLDSEIEIKLAFFKEMEDAFPEPQLQEVFDIIKAMAAQPDQINIIHTLLYPSNSSR
jgi:hypothetical protein